MTEQYAKVGRARALRDLGHYYYEIDDALGWYRGRAWVVLNRDRKRELDAASRAKYVARGSVALCDLPEDEEH